MIKPIHTCLGAVAEAADAVAGAGEVLYGEGVSCSLSTLFLGALIIFTPV